jgi:hypothetical protein
MEDDAVMQELENYEMVNESVAISYQVVQGWYCFFAEDETETKHHGKHSWSDSGGSFATADKEIEESWRIDD